MSMLSPDTKKRKVMAKPGQEPGKKTAFPMFKGFFGGNSASPTSKIVTSSDMKGGDKGRRNSKL